MFSSFFLIGERGEGEGERIGNSLIFLIRLNVEMNQ